MYVFCVWIDLNCNKHSINRIMNNLSVRNRIIAKWFFFCWSAHADRNSHAALSCVLVSIHLLVYLFQAYKHLGSSSMGWETECVCQLTVVGGMIIGRRSTRDRFCVNAMVILCARIVYPYTADMRPLPCILHKWCAQQNQFEYWIIIEKQFYFQHFNEMHGIMLTTLQMYMRLVDRMCTHIALDGSFIDEPWRQPIGKARRSYVSVACVFLFHLFFLVYFLLLLCVFTFIRSCRIGWESYAYWYRIGDCKTILAAIIIMLRLIVVVVVVVVVVIIIIVDADIRSTHTHTGTRLDMNLGLSHSWCAPLVCVWLALSCVMHGIPFVISCARISPQKPLSIIIPRSVEWVGQLDMLNHQ